jgi:hypothetical protein
VSVYPNFRRLCNPFSVNFCGGGHDVGVTG